VLGLIVVLYSARELTICCTTGEDMVIVCCVLIIVTDIGGLTINIQAVKSHVIIISRVVLYYQIQIE
jgi:hypothetical protein